VLGAGLKMHAMESHVLDTKKVVGLVDEDVLEAAHAKGNKRDLEEKVDNGF
jgi:hypothetical protein